MRSKRTLIWMVTGLIAVGTVGYRGSRHLANNPKVVEHSGTAATTTRQEDTPAVEAAVAQQMRQYHHPEEQPTWCIPYGKEFWRQPATARASDSKLASAAGQPPTSIHLGEVIDRVSHALTMEPAGSAPTVRAKTYAARLTGEGLRFSPNHLPATGSSATSGTATPEQRLAALADRTPETPEEEDALMARWSALPAEESIPPALTQRSQARRGDPRAVSQPDPQTEVAFQTVRIRQGTQIVEATSHQWAVLGNTAQALLDPSSGAVEHFEPRAEGVAVTWILHRPLSAKESLVVEAQLTGLTYAGQTTGGYHFADANGVARLRVGNATVVDATGARWPVPIQVENNSLTVTVPDSTLAQASYPLAIDPVISPEFGMDTPVLVAAPEAQQMPAVAANGGNFLVAWEDARNAGTNGGSIVGTRVTSTGNVSDPGGIMISPTGASHPAVAPNGTGYLVVWEDARNVPTTGFDLFGARVSSAGQVVNPGGFAISTAAGDQLAPAATANGSDSFVVWQDGRDVETAPDIYGARITVGGVVTDATGIPIRATTGVQVSPAVAFNGANFLVVWSEQSGGGDFETYGARVSIAGVVLDTGGLPLSTVAGGQYAPTVAALGTNFLVVWQDLRNVASGGFIDIFAERVTGAGTVLDRDGFPVGAGSGDRFTPAVATGTGDFLVVWQDARNQFASGMDIYGAHVTSGGVVEDPTGIPISMATDDQSSPALAFNGSNYLMAWTDARNFGVSDLDIYGALVDPSGKVSTPAGILLGTGSSDEQRPAVASNGNNYLVVWQDYRNSATSGIDLYGVRVDLNGAVLDLSAIPISTAAGDQVLPYVAASAGNYLVVWEDDRNAATSGADIYGTRVTGAGVVQDAAGIPISTASADQLVPAVRGDGADFLVVWQDARNLANDSIDIYAARVSTAGTVLDATGIPICTAPGAQYSAALAFNGTNTLVVWADERNLGSTGVDLYGARVTTAGVVLDSAGIPITQAPGDEVSPAVATAGGNFFVVWEDGRNAVTTQDDIYGARVTGGGVVLDAAGIPISVAAGSQSTPAVQSSGTNYLVVWQDERNVATGGVDIYGTSVGTDGTVMAPAGLAINPSFGIQRIPKLGTGSARTFLVVYESTETGASRVAGNLIHLDDFPILTAIEVGGGGITLTWISIPGRTYRVQFRSNLTSQAWTDLTPDVPATGAVTTKADSTLGGEPQRFYRVVLLP